MKIIENPERIIKCSCGTCFQFESQDVISMFGTTTFYVICPNCEKVHYVCLEQKWVPQKEEIVIEPQKESSDDRCL